MTDRHQGEGLPPESATGRFRVYKERTDARLDETEEQLALTEKRLRQGARTLRALKAWAALVVTTIPAGLWLMNRQDQATTKANSEVQAKLERHIEDEAQLHRQIGETVHELQMDLRALYRAERTGRPQPRLERLPDGGRP